MSVQVKLDAAALDQKLRRAAEARLYRVTCERCGAVFDAKPGPGVCPSCGKDFELLIQLD